MGGVIKCICIHPLFAVCVFFFKAVKFKAVKWKKSELFFNKLQNAVMVCLDGKDAGVNKLQNNIVFAKSAHVCLSKT